MIRVFSYNASRCYFLDKRKLEDLVRDILRQIGIKKAALSVSFVTDRKIRKLNREYRKKDRATDVLSFAIQEGKEFPGSRWYLGDVVISVERARKQARLYGNTFKKEIYLYIIHGILHLVGYDDEKSEERARMREKEREILERIWGKSD